MRTLLSILLSLVLMLSMAVPAFATADPAAATTTVTNSATVSESDIAPTAIEYTVMNLRTVTPNNTSWGCKGFDLNIYKLDTATNGWVLYTTMVFNESDTYGGGMAPIDESLRVDQKSWDGKDMAGVLLERNATYRIIAKYSDYPAYSSDALASNFVVDELGTIKYTGGAHFGNWGSYWNAKIVPGAALKIIKEDQLGNPLANVKFKLSAVKISDNSKVVLGQFTTNEDGVLYNNNTTNVGGLWYSQLLFGLSAANRDNLIESYNPITKTVQDHLWSDIFGLTCYSFNDGRVYYLLEEVVDESYPYVQGEGFLPTSLKITVTNSDGKGINVESLNANTAQVTTEQLYKDPVWNDGASTCYSHLSIITVQNNIVPAVDPEVITPEEPEVVTPEEPEVITPEEPEVIIPEEPTYPGEEFPYDENSDKPIVTAETDKPIVTAETEEAPQTGDSSFTLLWLVIGTMAGLVGLLLLIGSRVPKRR